MQRINEIVIVLLILCLVACTKTANLETELPPTPSPIPPGTPTSSATPAPSTTVPALSATSRPPAVPEPGPATVDDFITYLQDSLSQNDSDALRRRLEPVMHPDFTIQLYPAGQPSFIRSRQDAVWWLSHPFRPAEPVFHAEDVATLLPDGVDPLALFQGEQPVTATVYSTGWGQAGAGEALLFLTRGENGALSWAGLVVSYDNFQPLPPLETVVPSPGLVYRTGDQWWRVELDGQTSYLLEHPGPLSFNPDATHALFAETEGETVTVFELTGGASQSISRTVPLEARLMSGSGGIPWLDNETAVLMVTAPDMPVSQGSRGNLALLNTTSGELQVLSPELSIYARPATTEGGAIVFREEIGETGRRLAVWRAGEAISLALNDTPGNVDDFGIFNPVLSPDETRLVAVTGGDFGHHTFAYLMIDLEQQTTAVMHTFLPVPTDAVIPWGIHWSPDGRWLALEPPSFDLVESGVWLVSVDGSQKEFLGPGTGNPMWLPSPDGTRLLFNATINGETRLQQYNPLTGDRVWLGLPVGAQPVAGGAGTPVK